LPFGLLHPRLRSGCTENFLAGVWGVVRNDLRCVRAPRYPELQRSFRGQGRTSGEYFDAGDVGYVQQTLAHYIENTGDTDLKFLEMFKTDRYQDLSLSEWLSHTPPELVMAHLNIDRAVYDAIPKDKSVIVPE
jgi:Cupin